MPKQFVPNADYQTLTTRLASDIRDWQQEGSRVVGLSGAQGTGKSTLSHALSRALNQCGVRAVSLGLDDFYLTRAQRERLAEEVHPLLVTRGVPGTHDVELLIRTIDDLFKTGIVSVPHFIKSLDERAPVSQWTSIEAPIDVILLEGWCLGIRPEADDSAALNRLEAECDPDGRWRAYVEEQLATQYQTLFQRVDRWIYLQAPGIEQVHSWRRLQEQENAQQVAGGRAMSETELSRFLQHYERLTRRGMRQLPVRADRCVQLRHDHGIAGIRHRR